MADEFTNSILGGGRFASLSAESLELMGKQAANRYMTEDIPLNETISKLAAEHHDINSEQVKRVCEFANTAVYLAKHDQNKTAGANNSYPQFELADPSRIIQDMSDGARSTVTTDVDLAYSKLPQKAKTASAYIDDLRDTVIERVFGTNPEKKETSRGSAIHELMTAKTTLEGMDEQLMVRKEASQNALDAAGAELYSLTKQHLMDGHSFTDVLKAAESTGLSAEKIAFVLHPVIHRLMAEKVSSASSMQQATQSLSKIAHRIVNPEHPLVRSIIAVDQAFDEVEKAASARKEVQAEHARITSFIEESFLAKSAH